MQLEKKCLCPIYKKTCKQLDCAWFVQLRGTHPQTGADIDEYGCAVSWLPILLIEGAKETRQIGAAVESFRNEMVKSNAFLAAGIPRLLLGETV